MDKAQINDANFRWGLSRLPEEREQKEEEREGEDVKGWRRMGDWGQDDNCGDTAGEGKSDGKHT